MEVAHTRTNHNRSAGIALISVLMVMLSITVIGIGTLMLTNSNLLISENLVSQSVARSNAEAGIDAVIAVLVAEVAGSGSRPAAIPDPAVSLASGGLVDFESHNGAGGSNFEWNDDLATISVVGMGPRNARYEAQAVLQFSSDVVISGISPFGGAIVGCEAVMVLGGGRIDSFDSRSGAYSEATANRNAD